VPGAIDPALLHSADYDEEDLYLEMTDADYYQDYYGEEYYDDSYGDYYGEEYSELTGYGYEDE